MLLDFALRLYTHNFSLRKSLGNSLRNAHKNYTVISHQSRTDSCWKNRTTQKYYPIIYFSITHKFHSTNVSENSVMVAGSMVILEQRTAQKATRNVSEMLKSRSGLVLPFLSFLGLSRFSGIFPIWPGSVWGFSRFVPFLFLCLLRAPTRNSPKRVRDTIRTVPEKSGKPPGLETPWSRFSQ